MQIQFDFMLNGSKFGVVERLIFRFVLRGINSVEDISNLAWIFSEKVKARALQKLVNNQLLRANLQNQQLELSDYIVSIIDECRGKIYTLELPDVLYEKAENGFVVIDDIKVKEQILKLLLPDVNTAFLADSLVFTLKILGDEHG